MLLKQVMETMDFLDDPNINGQKVLEFMTNSDYIQTHTETIEGHKGTTDFIEIKISGKNGKLAGGTAPTIGIIGRLGGIGARPSRIGYVSDGDGAAAAVATAMKLSQMAQRGDRLEGDVIITTHICPHAPTQPHEPVDFMGSPVGMKTMNEYEVNKDCDAILSIDTTKGNVLMNYKGIAISPTVKSGYILPYAPDLINILSITTGEPAHTFGISTQDITPYENNLYHLNSIMQPATATDAPVVGVAITTTSAVPGSGTGASHEIDVALAATYAIEVAKSFTQGKVNFFNKDEFQQLQNLYGSMEHLSGLGK